MVRPVTIDEEMDPHWVDSLKEPLPPEKVPMNGQCVLCGLPAAVIPERVDVDSVPLELCPRHMALSVLEVLLQLSAIRRNAPPIAPPGQ